MGNGRRCDQLDRLDPVQFRVGTADAGGGGIRLDGDVPRLGPRLGPLHGEIADVVAEFEDGGGTATKGPPPGQKLRLPALLPEPAQLVEDQRLRIDEQKLRVVAKREGGHAGGDAAAAQHLKERVVRAVTSGLRRCGDRATKAVGDRDGKSPDGARRHPPRP